MYLKHGAGRFAADVMDEAARLAWLAGRIPVPIIRQFVAEADVAWLLTTALPGRTADQWLEDDPDALGEIVVLSADFLKTLHALPVDDCPFDAGHRVRMAAARRNIDAGLVDENDFDDDHAGWSALKVWDELVAMLPIAADRVVTHGDFSMGNLLFDDGRVTGCIDVGRVGVADRYQDLAIFWQNLAEHGTEFQSAFLRAYGIDTIDPDRLRFHCCLDELF
ncbi:aminoglycoside 3'-phosphotransferase [Sphingomonas sp. SUN019]|nr:aminoglycoside 3'-phosphotransferase [Sphingomonas sp. SUN019]